MLRHTIISLIGIMMLLPPSGIAAADNSSTEQSINYPANILAKRLIGNTLVEVAGIIDSARVVSLPIEPLVQKALEGATKKAPDDRIIGAVSALFKRLATARTILGQSSTTDELTAAAGAIYAGIDSTALVSLQMATAVSSKKNPDLHLSLSLELIVLSDMIRRGVPADTATTYVQLFAEEGISDDQLLMLRNHLGRQGDSGQTPAQTVSAWALHRFPTILNQADVKHRGSSSRR